MRWILALVCLFIALPQAMAAVPVTEDYVVSPRDTLEISVFQEAELSRTVVVSDDGTIEYPLLGNVPVQGLTRAQVDDLLTSRLGANYLRNPQITVYVDAIGSKPVEVHGAVENPGVYHLNRGTTTLAQIIGESGGIAQDKQASQVIVRRPGAAPITVNLESLLVSGEGNLALEANDVVFVPEANVVYVAGEVRRPGTITWTQGLSVSQALTQAGGPDDTASLRNAYILRGGERIAVNLRRIYKGTESDITLEPNDQLFLRQSVF